MSLILLLALGMGLLVHRANADEKMILTIAEAACKQTGTEKNVKRYVRKLEKRYVPDDLKPYASWTFTLTKAAVERKIVYKWTF